MNAQTAPTWFPHFSDAQEYLAQHAGGAPFDYARDKPETLEAARRLGIEESVAAAIRLSRDLDGTVSDSVKRAERNVSTLDSFRFDRGEPGVPARRAAREVERLQEVRSPGTPLPGYLASAVWEQCYTSPELVRSLLGTGQFTTLFGQSGHFKSVIAIDVAMSAGLGLDYQGMRCARRVGVLYIAGEGHAGIRKRMRAWMISRGMDATSDQPSVYVTSEAGDLIGNAVQLRSTAVHAAATLGLPIELVVIDTLAANFGAGDEHHPRDMQLALAGARHAAPAAAVLLVHHVGHGQNERRRGSYSLIAAADYRIQASYDEVSKSIELRWHKVKDDERPESLLFNWRSVPLGWEDDDGKEVTSAVLERLEGGSRPVLGPRTVGLGKNQEKALKVLRTLLARARKNLAERGDDPALACILTAGWRTDLESRGVDRRRFHEVQADLIERGLIRLDGPHVHPVEVAP